MQIRANGGLPLQPSRTQTVFNSIENRYRHQDWALRLLPFHPDDRIRMTSRLIFPSKSGIGAAGLVRTT
jgi:hypothetical protein